MPGLREYPVLKKSYNAAADLSAEASLGKATKRDTSGNTVLCDTAGERSNGILVTNSRSVAGGNALYGPVSVESKGVCGGRLGGTVARRDYLTTNASGQLVVVSAPGQHVRAIALEAGVSGDLADVELVDFILPCVPFNFFVNFLDLDNKTVVAFTPGFTGKVSKTALSIMHAGTDSTGKTAVLSPKIATVAITGGIISMDSTGSGANNAAVASDGTSIAGTTVTALNAFGPTDALTVVCDNTAPFTDGSGNLTIFTFPTGT